jgi:hypothetical protein
MRTPFSRDKADNFPSKADRFRPIMAPRHIQMTEREKDGVPGQSASPYVKTSLANVFVPEVIIPQEYAEES